MTAAKDGDEDVFNDVLLTDHELANFIGDFREGLGEVGGFFLDGHVKVFEFENV